MKIELKEKTKIRVFSHGPVEGKFNRIYAFIGDGIIDFYLRQKLFQVYFNDLKKASIERSILASTRSLAYVAKLLNLEEEIVKSEQVNVSDSLLATIFEAYCCGIYLDYGLNKVFEFLEEELWSRRDFLIENFADFISKLKYEYPNSHIEIQKIGNIYKFKLYIGNNFILETNHHNKHEGKYEIAKKFFLEKVYSQQRF